MLRVIFTGIQNAKVHKLSSRKLKIIYDLQLLCEKHVTVIRLQLNQIHNKNQNSASSRDFFFNREVKNSIADPKLF